MNIISDRAMQLQMLGEGFRHRWDVFLNFRGEDTRDFTDYLKDTLESNHFRVFRDDGLDRGDEIAPTLFQAIEDSSAFIVIFSPDYASSHWCLDELANICDRTTHKHTLILPVFYRVDPSHVRQQKGPFEKAFRTYEANGVDNAKVQPWRNAMQKVGGFAGDVFNDTGASERRSLVQKISKELRNVLVGAAQYRVGLDECVEEVMKLLHVQSNGVRVLGLYGVGGVGKTTLANTLFTRLVPHFGCRSFVSNVRQVSSQNDGLICLQKSIISDLCPGVVVPINDVNDGISAIEGIVHENRVLLVLDDVDDLKQVDTLIGKRERFYEGSLVIITTRDRQVLPKCHVSLSYEVKALDPSKALELFSYHALRRKQPRDKFLSFSKEIVSLIGTLPLTLEVFGSFLFSKRGVQEWVDALGKLRQIRPGHLDDVLKICINGLDEEEMCAFLNIAFVQMRIKRDVINILRYYGFRGEIAITVLTEKCLIKITEDNMLWMRDEIRDMAKQIVLADPHMLSTLWDRAEILHVLKGEKDMAKRIDFVDDINPLRVDWKIKVRIIRMWRVPYMHPKKPPSIEMVLMDERGGRIHATIKRTLISSFKSLVNEGAAYQMTNFEVNHNDGKYRTTRHKFKLNFIKQTSVIEGAQEIPREGFLFLSFLEIVLLKDESETFLVDVNGKVVEKGNVIEKQSKGKKTKRLEVELEDQERNKLKCVLWDKYADKMASSLAEEKAGSIVFIQMGRVKVYNDDVEISNEYFGTKLLINSTVTTDAEYRNKILHGKDSYSQRSSQMSRRLGYSISKNLIKVENKKTIDEILKASQPVICFTLAKITEIDMKYCWWYIACERCSTKVKQRGCKSFCKKCDKFVVSTIPRFKVQVKVDDGTGTTSFIIFDPVATQILGKTATDIRHRIIKDGVEDMYPAELYELLDKKYLFKVKIKENSRNYSVIEMKHDDNLIGRSLPTTAKQDSISNDIEVTLPNKTPSKRLYSEALVEDPTEQLTRNKMKINNY